MFKLELPTAILFSLAPLTMPKDHTMGDITAAQGKLKAYEQALGITPNAADVIQVRVQAVKAAAEQLVLQTLSSEISIDASKLSSLSTENAKESAQKLLNVLETINLLTSILSDKHPANRNSGLPAPNAAGVYAELTDSRGLSMPPHPVYLFSVEPHHATVMQELRESLGQEGIDKLLGYVKHCGLKFELDRELEASQVTLFLASHGKHKNRDLSESRSASTTQAEDLAATVHGFASDLTAIVLCARTIEKVNKRDRLSEGEQNLYQKLQTGLRSHRCTLDLDSDDCLRIKITPHGNASALGVPLDYLPEM